MRLRKIEIKRRVWIAGLAAIGVSSAWWVWSSRVPPASPAWSVSTQPHIRLAGADAAQADQVLLERAKLFDPTPLFFPTEWNYGQQPLQEGKLKQPGQVFGAFEPKLTVGEQGVPLFRGEAPPVPEKLSDVLSQGSEASFAGMGQIDRVRSTMPIRAGYLEVRDLESNHIVISQSLSGVSPPRSDFAPVEFLVAVSSAGIVGEPILTSGSEGDDVDNFFRDYLVRSYRLGERLRPGRYRVVVGA